MRKFCKGLTPVICVMVIILALTSCASSMSVTCNVGTGDTIKVTLDTSEGFMLEGADDYGFYVTQDDDKIFQAAFVDEDDYEAYKHALDDLVEIIEEDSANGITWTSYNLDGRSSFIVWINGSDTGLVMGGMEDYDTEKKVFDSLTFSVK
ncbi:MAG: hypothetical protein K2J95_02635 [Lachnospiraceae bacterium]|nr:hypothetical protein [Lachnospiraceae bacterium]